jgi:protoheme IX farnesyltransferase
MPTNLTPESKGFERGPAEKIGKTRGARIISQRTMDANPTMTEKDAATSRGSRLRGDLAVLMKVRLNIFVLVTTCFGFLLASRADGLDWLRLWHTLLGTAAAAFGSAAFNQLMEIDLDARMKRTADRPLPARRMSVLSAFAIGWILSAFGIIHLAVKVAPAAAFLAAATIAIYVFVYTPLKRISTINTLVGAIPGAVPPVIGWVAAGGTAGWEASFLFGLLFLWQLPHFIAINWLCREEYEAAGYRMWSNGDVSGRKSGALALLWSACLAALSLIPQAIGFANITWTAGGTMLALTMTALSWRFMDDGRRESARRLFFFTLLYLPLALAVLLIGWQVRP